MGFIYRIIGLFLMVIGGYIGFNAYEGIIGDWINDTFLRNIYSLLILGIWGLVFILVALGLTLFLGEHPIKWEEERKKEEELAKQQELKRLNSLPKCPSCNEPLDEINNTFTRTLKEKKVSNIKITHKEFEFYYHIGDITKINSIRCHNCNNSFDEEIFEENASQSIKAKCPVCESFDTKFIENELVDNDNIISYSVVCKCNDCSHSWHSTQKEEQLKEQKQAELEQERKEAIEYQKQLDELAKMTTQTSANQQRETTKQKVRDGIKVKYRIRTIGTDQEEIVQSNSESEARRIIQAKYPNMDLHIISTVYNYK